MNRKGKWDWAVKEAAELRPQDLQRGRVLVPGLPPSSASADCMLCLSLPHKLHQGTYLLPGKSPQIQLPARPAAPENTLLLIHSALCNLGPFKALGYTLLSTCITPPGTTLWPDVFMLQRKTRQQELN